MEPKPYKSPAKDENGFVLIVVMLFMMVLSVIGIAGNYTTNTEVQIAGNERFINDDFYRTESQLIDAIERFQPWLNDDAFLTAAETAAKYKDTPSVDMDGDGVNEDYILEVRCIEDSKTPITGTDGLSDYANDIPGDTHIGPAPADSGYGTNFRVFRFAVTIRSAGDRTILQAGVYRAFPLLGGE